MTDRRPLRVGGADPLLDPPEGLPPAVRQRLLGLDTAWGQSVLWTVVWIGLALGVATFLAKGANGPADPSPQPERASARVRGFGEAAFSIQPEGQPATEPGCALTADEPRTWQQGMMGRRDLAGYDAMVFRFRAPSDQPFFNRNVPVALSIAWFDLAGRFVSSTDMPACEDREGCPLYHPTGPYRYAVETLQGGLTALGAGPGTVLAVGGPCTGR
ncbi:MAG TPA: DUF192 domain-containing protein [Acidimicrobiales bacterium]|nr:DUF192 domain-containing protein [Acidimicrobiales bacterium]